MAVNKTGFINIAQPLNSTKADDVLAYSEQIYDTTEGKMVSAVLADLKANGGGGDVTSDQFSALEANVTTNTSNIATNTKDIQTLSARVTALEARLKLQ